MTDWDALEDGIADVINDSLDIDWTGRVGARAVVQFLKDRDAAVRESRICHVCQAVGSADHAAKCSESW